MTVTTTSAQDLTALRDRLQQKVDAKNLALAGDTTTVAALDGFFATRAVTIVDPDFQLTDATWPRTLTVSGTTMATWSLIGMGADAVSTHMTLTFTQTAATAAIIGTFTTDASVTIGATVIALTGSLGVKNSIVFGLPTSGIKLPLPAVGNFAFSSSFGGWLPTDLPLFTEMPFTQIQVTASYGGGASATCAVTTGVAGDWSIVSGGPSLTGVALTLAATTTIKQGQRTTALSAALTASLMIGGQPWDVMVMLSGGSQVSIVVRSRAKEQPALAALAGLIAGDEAAAAVTNAIGKLPLVNLELDRIEIAFDWKAGKLLFADIAATLPFTFNHVPADFELSVAVPPLSLGGGLSRTTPVKIRDVIIEYLGDAGGFPDTTVTELAFTTVPSEGSFGFSLAMEDVFSVGPVSLDTVSVEIAKTSAGVTGAMTATLTIGGDGGIGVLVEAAYDAGWRIAGSTAYGQVIEVGHLIQELAGPFKVNVPDALNELKLENLAVTIDTAKEQFTFGCAGSFPIATKTLDFTVAIDVGKDSGGWNGSFIGTFKIGEASFKVTFKTEPGVRYLRAEFQPTSGKLSMTEIAQTFGIDLSDVPAELLPVLTSVTFTYDFIGQELVLTAATENVAVTFVSVPDTNGRLYAAVVKVAVKADISQLPVIGTHLAEIEDIGLDGMSLVIASGVFTAKEIDDVNKVIPAGQPTLPTLAAAGRVILSANLTLGGQPASPLQLAFGKPDTGKQPVDARPMMALAGPVATEPSSPAPSGTSSGQGKWINIQKSIGPITLNRAAVAYRDQLVWLMLDGGFAMGPVEIDLMGAAIGFRPTLPPVPAGASLDGLFVGFEAGGVSLSGGLLKYTPEDGPVEYDGQLSLKVPQFQISAMGSYASLPEGPSLFAYAVLVAPIGGPPFLQIDAVAAGFGFNRNLVIPGLNKLSEMPLIAAIREGGGSPFAGKDAAQALKVLHDYVQPQYGEYFFAAGVRVASCQMIKGFVLATVKLGTEFEIALLGLATLSVPPAAPSPIGFAELVLMADINFTRGTLMLGAQLTAASYILSKDCHLTGGFVVAAWFKDDPTNPQGYKAGDFLVSLGGYHPAFTRPAWYPDVPRLGFNWSVGQLTIKGGMYFALVPSAVMAGGSLEAVWQSGDLRAWFTAWMDFLLGWKPFHYEADIGVSLGASYKVNIGVTSFTVSLHVGVQIKLWGPEFGGTATVDLYVISITIGFGNSTKTTVQPIGWDDFKASFLSDTKSPPHRPMMFAAMETGPTPIQTSAVCLTKVANGLLQDLAGAGGVDWVLDPERFELTTWSAIPSKSASYTGSGPIQQIDAVNTDFGIGPSGVSAANFASTHTVTISKRDGEMAADDIRVDVQPVLETLPAATWSTDAALDPSLARLNDAQARTIPNALTGLRITAKQDNPDVTPLPVLLDRLRHERDQQSRSVVWDAPAVPTATGYDGRQPMLGFTEGLVADSAVANRKAILAVLADHNVPVARTVNVTQLAASAPNILFSPPMLSVLGAEPVRQAA